MGTASWPPPSPPSNHHPWIESWVLTSVASCPFPYRSGPGWVQKRCMGSTEPFHNSLWGSDALSIKQTSKAYIRLRMFFSWIDFSPCSETCSCSYPRHPLSWQYCRTKPALSESLLGLMEFNPIQIPSEALYETRGRSFWLLSLDIRFAIHRLREGCSFASKLFNTELRYSPQGNWYNSAGFQCAAITILIHGRYYGAGRCYILALFRMIRSGTLTFLAVMRNKSVNC